MKLLHLLRPSLLAIALVSGIPSLGLAQTVIITSENFSIGYGFANDGVSTNWNTFETASANTPTIQGDFSFTPSVSGAAFSSIGVDFPDRVLVDRTTLTASHGHTGNSTSFAASITAAWTGSLPGDAELDPNYQLRLVITQISLYAAGTSTQTTTNINLTETTSGNSGTSPTFDVGLLATTSNGTFNQAAYWEQVVWNPNDFWQDGTSSTRSFAVSSPEARGLDGFEIFGYVELSYAAIPEPGVAGALFGVAALGILILRRRRRC